MGKSCSDCEVCGAAALYVPPGDVAALADGIWQGLTDEARRAQLQQAGREQIKQFTWEAMAQRARRTGTIWSAKSIQSNARQT